MSKIVLKHKSVNHSLYADDLIIFSKCKDINSACGILSALIADFNTSGKLSGAKMSIEKFKILHICKKTSCTKNIVINVDDTIVNNVNNLRILDIIFDKRFNFKEYCINLKSKLSARVSIIKYLSSKNSFCHVNSLINITRAIILSKIDYGLSIYGVF